MSLINESIQAAQMDTDLPEIDPADLAGSIPGMDNPGGEIPAAGGGYSGGIPLPDLSGLFSQIIAIIKTPTGPGEIEQYQQGHPMNPKQSYGTGQFLRGATGFAGDLKLAVLDMLFGWMEMKREKSGASIAGIRRQKAPAAAAANVVEDEDGNTYIIQK